MADFSPENLTVAAPQSVTPVQAGVTKSPLMLEGVNSLMKQGIAVADTIIQRKGEAALQDFTERQLNIIRAVEQGAPGFTNTSYARSMMQKNLFDMIETYGRNPEMRKQILAEHNAILGAGDMFGNISKGTTEEIRRNAMRSSLVAAGYVDADADEAGFQAAENVHQRAAIAERDYGLQMKQLELNSKALNYTQDRQAYEKEQITDGFLKSSLPSLVVQYDASVKAIQTSNMTPAQKAQAIAAKSQEMLTANAQYLLDMNPDKRTAVEKMFREREKLATDIAMGTIEASAAKTQLDLLKDQSVMNALTSSPLVAKAYGLSAIDLQGIAMISGSAGVQVTEQLGNYLVTNSEASGNSANLFDNTPEAKKAKDAYFKVLSKQGSNPSPEAQANLEVQLSNVVLGIEDYSSLYARDPSAAMALVDWMATPEFLEMRKKHPKSFENIDGAKEALQINFNDEVWGKVQKKFVEGKVFHPGSVEGVSFLGLVGAGVGMTDAGQKKATSVATPDAVTYEFGAAGIRFKAIDPNDERAASSARQLNKEVAPAIMKTIKASAHLAGRTDYDKMFEEVAPMIFSNQSPDGDSGDDISLGSVGGSSSSSNDGKTKVGSGVDLENVSEEANNAWSALSGSWGGPDLVVKSGYRSAEHNAAVGGAKGSQHIHGNAFDVDVSGMDESQRLELISSARQAGFKGIGVYKNSLHFDVGPSRAWGPSYHADSIPDWAKEALQ